MPAGNRLCSVRGCGITSKDPSQKPNLENIYHYRTRRLLLGVQFASPGLQTRSFGQQKIDCQREKWQFTTTLYDMSSHAVTGLPDGVGLAGF